jgi:hypothetical protein
MKKFILLFLSFAVLTACGSDDDDNTTQGGDPIVGTWVLVQINPAIVNVSDCPQESTITFNADNSGSGTFYFKERNCEPENSSGNWANNGNSNYSIQIPILGTVQGNATFEGNKFIFTTSMGIFTFEKQ